MRMQRVYQLGRLARSDPPSESYCRPGWLHDRSPNVSYHIGSSFLLFALLIWIDGHFLNGLVMGIFLDLADESLLSLTWCSTASMLSASMTWLVWWDTRCWLSCLSLRRACFARYMVCSKHVRRFCSLFFFFTDCFGHVELQVLSKRNFFRTSTSSWLATTIMVVNQCVTFVTLSRLHCLTHSQTSVTKWSKLSLELFFLPMSSTTCTYGFVVPWMYLSIFLMTNLAFWSLSGSNPCPFSNFRVLSDSASVSTVTATNQTHVYSCNGNYWSGILIKAGISSLT